LVNVSVVNWTAAISPEPVSRAMRTHAIGRPSPLELVYADQDGEPHVVISAKKLAQNKALAARQLGQLVAAARQVVGIEEWTSVSTIRKVVTDYGRLDSGNFASTIQQMDNVAVIRGKGQSREVKITKPGLEATADPIKGIAGVEM
jgi:hypothetical protein